MGATLARVQRGETYAGYTDLEVMCCHACGVLHALPKKLIDRARKDPDLDWYCPNGHCAHFPGETEEDRLRRRAEMAENAAARARAQRDQAEADARAQKAAKTRIKNDRDRIKARAGNGVCPCCNRSFTNLRRHMQSQHPEFAHDASEA